MRTLLIDGDVVNYIASCRAEQKYDWGDTGTTHVTDYGRAEREVSNWIEEIQNRLEADGVIIALSDSRLNYFRTKLWPEYKAHRTHGKTPMGLEETRKAIRQNFNCISLPTLEADDCLGIWQTRTDLDLGETVIVTTDKDLLQIPGYHANPRKLGLGIDYIEPLTADFYFYTQALTGDPTDNFPGCRGIGPKKAAKAFRAARESWIDSTFTPMDHAATYGSATPQWVIWNAIVKQYEAAGQSAEYALTQARVARILRASDYNFNTEKPILWTPVPDSQLHS